MFRKNHPFSKRRRFCLPRSLWKDSFKKGRHPNFFPDMYFWGTMRQKMTIFKGGNSFCRDAKMYCRLMKNRGDDATENVNFQRRKQRLQGPKISSSILMSFRRKIGGRCDRKCQFSKEETAFAGCKNLRLNFKIVKTFNNFNLNFNLYILNV